MKIIDGLKLIFAAWIDDCVIKSDMQVRLTTTMEEMTPRQQHALARSTMAMAYDISRIAERSCKHETFEEKNDERICKICGAKQRQSYEYDEHDSMGWHAKTWRPWSL